MDTKQPSKQSCHSPPPNPPSSSLLKDISNFKTPKPHSSQTPKFFTASKTTPQSLSSSVRSRRVSKAAKKLKAFELEQSKSARKTQITKEKSLKSLAKSLTIWLNFLFENPKTCSGENPCGELEVNGKRKIDRPWRRPKRQRDSSWLVEDETSSFSFANSMFCALRESLREVCSFEDLKERMRVYLTLGSCMEVFKVMTQVTKNIDEGRLKMKANCAIITDVGMKEKAMKILMCYNPIWLRIGLYIILGGDSLLPNGDVDSEQDIVFLKMVIEKQFFSHAALAKAYAYNKLVDGLYRPGYFEKLGNVILKRFLLLVLILDRAKSQSSLPIDYGIDGLDGGSPLLFTLQSNIKSSRHIICDFLSSDVMHGEGNLIAHLVIVGYKVFYQQSPLIEYDFRMTDLFEDLHDGIRLCRAIQLLQHDPSILMKMVVPSDTRKKNLGNCSIALQHLKQAGVPLYDDDGTVIIGEDVVNGDKELTISLLWNMFVHLQLPLLINKTILSEEIGKIRGVDSEHVDNCTLLDMLLNWVQAICQSYDYGVDNFASLVDGKAMWCLLDYYFRKEYCSCPSKDLNETNEEGSIMSATDYTDAVHNFILSQKLTSLLGNFPEVLQVSDILEHNGACNGRSVVILLVFLSFQLIVKRNTDQLNFHKFFGFNCQNREKKSLSTDRWFVHPEALLNYEETQRNSTEDTTRNFKAIMSWWQDMAKQNSKCDLKPATPLVKCYLTARQTPKMQRGKDTENYMHELKVKAAFRIQLAWKKHVVFKSLSGQHTAATKIQSHLRCWLARKSFAKKKQAIVKIQSIFRCIKCWRDFQHYKLATSAAIIIQSQTRGWIVRTRAYRLERFAVAIQRHCRGLLVRRELLLQREAAIRIQTAFRFIKCRKAFHSYRHAVIKVQSFVRGQITRMRLIGASCLHKDKTIGYSLRTSRGSFQSLELKIFLNSVMKLQRWWRGILLLKSKTNSATIIQSHIRRWIDKCRATKARRCIVVIQSHCRGGLVRRELLLQREAAIRIQTDFRCLKCRKAVHSYRHAAIKLQSFVRGQITRKRLLGASCSQAAETIGIRTSRDSLPSLELKIFLNSVMKLQRWWRSILLLKAKSKSAIIIQSHIRGWIARCRATRERRCIVAIQSHCRGWLLRRELLLEREAALKIQNAFRCLKCWKTFNCYRHAAKEIQSFVRGQILRKRLLGASCPQEIKIIGLRTSMDSLPSLELKIFLNSVMKLQRWWRGILLLKSKTKSAIIIQSYIRGWIARCRATRERRCIVAIQSHCRGWLSRRELLLERKAAIKIQNAFRCIKCWKTFKCYRHAAKEIQRFVRGRIIRKRLLGSSCLQEAKTISIRTSTDCLPSLELQIFLNSALKLRSWWRDVSFLKQRTKSAIIIQSHIRGWIARRAVTRKKRCTILIQSFWKGYLARRDSREELLDLRLRVKKSAANVDDGMRIMNRLLAALSELLNKKSVSGILHICQTLDMATEHSEKCCEKLVAAGAVDTLLKLIRSVSRSIPDQVVLKHALSTLRNLVRYPHLSQALIDCPGSIQTILMEFLRNKEEGYFIASELLKKIFLTRSGVEATRNVPALLKRLHSLVEDLTRKADKEKRNARGLVAKELTEKRLREAVQLMKLLTNG